MGVRLLGEQDEKLLVKEDDATADIIDDNIMLLPNTTSNDCTGPKNVMEKCIQGCCLWSELDVFIGKGRTLYSSMTVLILKATKKVKDSLHKSMEIADE